MKFPGIMAAGGIVLALGILFHLQGQSVVGPAQSFMYGSPEWVRWGIWIAVSGVLILAAGAVAYVRTRRPRDRRA